MDSRRATIIMALIAFICFFLPWVEVSCGSAEDRLTGIDLARDGQSELWLIPVLMLALLILVTTRAWENRRRLSALASMVVGLVSTYLMNRQRMRAEDSAGLVAVGLTGWFWLGFGSTIALVIVSALRYLKRART